MARNIAFTATSTSQIIPIEGGIDDIIIKLVSGGPCSVRVGENGSAVYGQGLTFLEVGDWHVVSSRALSQGTTSAIAQSTSGVLSIYNA